MAKETTPQKASEATRSPAVSSGPTEANRDAELLEGANATALVAAMFKEVMSAIKTLPVSIEAVHRLAKTTAEGVTDLYSQIDDIPKQQDAKKVEELAFEMLTKMRRTDWRTFLWQTERREVEHKDSKYHLPRPSIVGRTLHELGAFGKTHWQVGGRFFRRYKTKGRTT